MALDVLLTPLRQIATSGGDVYHAMKAGDPGSKALGEAYFSFLHKGHIKGWRKHLRMTLNLVVPMGRIQFRVLDEASGTAQNFVLGPQGQAIYARLTVGPGMWMAFSGLDDTNMLLNLADILHDPDEAVNMPIDSFAWEWATS